MFKFIKYYIKEYPQQCNMYISLNDDTCHSLYTHNMSFYFIRNCLDNDLLMKEKISDIIHGNCSSMELLSAHKSENPIIKASATYFIHTKL